MARTHEKVRFLPKGKQKHTVASAALFHLFGGHVRRFSELRRAIPAVSEKMLIQQLRQMERDGIVRRFVHHQVPPKVEYSLTEWGQALCPALDALLKWGDLRGRLTEMSFEEEFHASPDRPGRPRDGSQQRHRL
jgi:DNA-binding HxlR family transcriptional regulator